MWIERLLRPELAIVCLTGLGSVVLFLLAWFQRTESRSRMRNGLALTRLYFFVGWVIAMLLLFAMKYIPTPYNHTSAIKSPVISRYYPPSPKQSPEEFYKENFSNLLTILGVFSTLFGVVVPFAGYLLQHKNLKDEAETLRLSVSEYRRMITNEQQKLQKMVVDLTDEVHESKVAFDNLRSRRDYVMRCQIDGVRASMETLLAVYRVGLLPLADKEKIIKGYLVQFIGFLRLAACTPQLKPFSSDVGRFQDAMKLFRKDSCAYSNALTDFSHSLLTDPPQALPGLHLALTAGEYAKVESELACVAHSLFSE